MVIICMYDNKMDPKKLECDNVNYINWPMCELVVECSEHGNKYSSSVNVGSIFTS